MRRALNDGAGAREALLTEAGDQRIEDVVEWELFRNRIAQVSQRKTKTLRMRAMRLVNELCGPAECGVPNRGTHDHVASNNHRPFARQLLNGDIDLVGTES